MPITTTAIASDILNRVAVEVGMVAVVDPFASQDQVFVQLKTLINIAGEELALMYDWGDLVKQANVNTDMDDSGSYPLPTDFLKITNQTCWERNNRVPVIMLSAQQWQYLEGRQFAKDTIYAKFRLQQGQFTIYPQPAPSGLDIYYEYTSKNWVLSGTNGGAEQDFVETGSDTPIYDKTLFSRYLKLKWLEAKGFDTTKAQDDFNQIFALLTGFDKGAPILNAGGGNRAYPYLNAWNNVGDTGYGSS